MDPEVFRSPDRSPDQILRMTEHGALYKLYSAPWTEVGCFYLATVTVVAWVSIHESSYRKYDRCFESTWRCERSPCCDPWWCGKFRNLGRKSNFLEAAEELVSCLVDVPYVGHL